MKIKDFFEMYSRIEFTWGKRIHNIIDYCGLEPVMPAQRDYYSCTPKNSVTFARTGGDGVHFSVIDSEDENACGPIVMTVPMAAITNVVVAENLQEFLSLGCYAGWFHLEQIVYDLNETIEYYSSNNIKVSDKEERFLILVRNAFKLTWSPLSQNRLNQLEEEFFYQLQIDNI